MCQCGERLDLSKKKNAADTTVSILKKPGPAPREQDVVLSQEQIEEAVMRVVGNNRADLVQEMACDKVLVLALAIRVEWDKVEGHPQGGVPIYRNEFTFCTEDTMPQWFSGHIVHGGYVSGHIVHGGYLSDEANAYFVYPLPATERRNPLFRQP